MGIYVNYVSKYQAQAQSQPQELEPFNHNDRGKPAWHQGTGLLAALFPLLAPNQPLLRTIPLTIARLPSQSPISLHTHGNEPAIASNESHINLDAANWRD